MAIRHLNVATIHNAVVLSVRARKQNELWNDEKLSKLNDFF